MPAAMICTPPCCWAQHHCKYDVDEDALINSVKLYVQVALDFNFGC